MRAGKLDNDVLNKLVLDKLKRTREEVVCSPKVGVDCAAINFGGAIAVFSTDPITSATANLGGLTVHVSCNDAAAAGAEPIGLLITILAPTSATEEDIGTLADELAKAAEEANVDIIGGHTEVTNAVTRLVTSATVIARSINDKPILPSGMKPGNSIVLTKSAGIEGASIIAHDLTDRVQSLSKAEIETAKSFSELVSVVKEGVYAAKHGATAMHDVTEGGVLGAIWEMASASDCGVQVSVSLIPIHPVTSKICDIVGVNPMRLISSGCMLIACDNGEELCKGLERIGVDATVIGHATADKRIMCDGNEIEPPQADELYRLFD